MFLLQAHAAFEDAVELIGSLLFVLGPMLDRLIALAMAKALALLSVQLMLKLEGATTHAIAVRPVCRPRIVSSFLNCSSSNWLRIHQQQRWLGSS